MSIETKPVRESLNWRALEDYVHEKLALQLGDSFDSKAPMHVEQFAGGHSNLTYLLRFGAQEFAMRRPPFGPVPAKAHDMARECRILTALNPVFPLAPRPYVLCEDPQVIGSTFYIMERRRGLVVRQHEPVELVDNPPQRRRASLAMVNVLADLHNVDLVSNGLESLGKPNGFVERQVRGWSQRWEGSKITEQPEMDQLSAWLIDRLPEDPAKPSLVHGDYKLDNVMFDANDVGRITAVFDWEMSAVGDPLIDMGIFLAYWVHALPIAQSDSLGSVTDRPGWFSRDEILEQYAERSGRDLSQVRFYEVFAVFKIAVVLQQIFYRYHRGQTDDERFAKLDKHVENLARIGSRLAELSS